MTVWFEEAAAIPEQAWENLQLKVTVLGDCGLIHKLFEEWKNCLLCESILMSRHK